MKLSFINKRDRNKGCLQNCSGYFNSDAPSSLVPPNALDLLWSGIRVRISTQLPVVQADNLRQFLHSNLVIIIIIIIIIISFMQGIYTYIPETNHVHREYSVSAILSFLRWQYCTFTLALSEVLCSAQYGCFL